MDATTSEKMHLSRNRPRCVNLSTVTTSPLSLSRQVGYIDELCEVCSQVDLAECFAPVCIDCKVRHYYLGKVVDIQSRTGCALCRLIMATHKSAGFHASDLGTEVCTLVFTSHRCDKVNIYFNAPESNWDVENKAAVHVIRQCIDNSMLEDWANDKSVLIKDTNVEHSEFMAAKRIGGRPVHSFQVEFDRIRDWLHLCEISHGDECKPSRLISRTASKIRLIDVVQGKIIDATTGERYLALSYVWGSGPQFCLDTHNEGNLRMAHGLEAEAIPRTVQDAINLVAKIGEKYLWVDRLCILMDDERDKLEQMSRMDQIYNSATLTIVNADACCSNTCIPGIQPGTRRSMQHSEVIRGVKYITTQADPISEILRTNWSTRGWTYQEVFLSSRCLVFTKYQSYFQCKSDMWCEDSCSNGAKARAQNSSIGNALCHLPDLQLGMERCSFYQYVDAVEGFSRRRLTLETDSLWAFTGVTKAFQTQFPDGFIWGLPVENIDAALLWDPKTCRSGLRGGSHAAILDSDMIRLPFPSWSWVSWGGGVQFGAKCEEEVKGLVECHQPAHYAVNTASPFSEPWNQVAEYDETKWPSHTVMDERALGFLRFTATSTILEIEPVDSNESRRTCSSPDPCFMSYIRTPAGEEVGFIQVKSSWLETHDRKNCEFILLSAKIENTESETCRRNWVFTSPDRKVSNGVKHADGCKHQSNYNIMLIDWKEGPHCFVATRVGIAQIKREDWGKLESTSKLIVLG